MRVALSIVVLLASCESGGDDPPDGGFFYRDAAGSSDGGQVKQDKVLVDYVFDGDTVRLNAGPDAPLTPDGKPLKDEVVRLLGVDAPEIEHAPTPADCWGPESAAAARELLLGREVTLEYDTSHGFRDSTDSHRLLAYVLIKTSNKNANGELIRLGHACSYRRFQHRLIDQFNGFEGDAESARSGQWGSCTDPCP
ncbi:MAG: thermonuclease family protein [Deltaproteobacteria bacterium]|nr:thermonuclease family protein [Deltaproteobacteria bacterium]